MENIEDEEIILSELNDKELMLQMHDDLYDGFKEDIEEEIKACKLKDPECLSCGS